MVKPTARVYDPRDGGARMWDALVQVAHHALTTHAVPDSHGTRTRLVVSIDHQTLLAGVAHAARAARELPVTSDGLDLPVGVVRRLACDAQLIPLVLGSRVIGIEVARELVERFLEAKFSGEERHVRRLQKVLSIERRYK